MKPESDARGPCRRSRALGPPRSRVAEDLDQYHELKREPQSTARLPDRLLLGQTFSAGNCRYCHRLASRPFRLATFTRG